MAAKLPIRAALLACALLLSGTPFCRTQGDDSIEGPDGADAAANVAEATESPTPSPGPCDYLAAGPGLGPLQRNVEAALRGEADEIVVGALGIKGSDRLYSQWNDTFATYMTDVIGPKLGNKTFRLVYLDFDTAYRAVEDNCFDFVFANPSMHLCLELGWEATPVVTLLNYRQGFELDRFMGTIFTRSNDTSIQELKDIKGKILEGVSVTGLGAFQMQWHEFWANNVDLFNEPAQVRFAYNQQKIVKDVIAGRADVGLVRTDMAEGMAGRGIINLTDVKVINLKPDDEFPFPYSTNIAAPEWPLAALPHISTSARKIVSDSMTKITADHPAAVTGLYAGWVPPVSYMGLFTMMGDLGYLRNNRCTGNSDTYDTITCPDGFVKIGKEEFDTSCSDLVDVDPEKYTCPDGYICVCNPCKPAPLKPPEIPTGAQAEEPEKGPNVVLIAILSCVGVVVAAIIGFLSYRAFGRKDNDDPSSLTSNLNDISIDISTELKGNNINSMVSKMAEESKGIKMKNVESNDADAPVVLELLATSGNSRVYKAMWRGVIVAQKRIELPTNPSTFQKKQSSMAMEAAISASMSHPNVVQTYNCEIVPIKRNHLTKEQQRMPIRSSTSPDLGRLPKEGEDAAEAASEADVIMWEMHIIQELCNRGSVTACLSDGTLPGQDGSRTPPNLMLALHIAKDVACGMLHIHSMQIVHGDLKSGNVLLVDTKREGLPEGIDMIGKVADFGLAVKMDESQTHISGVQSGTLTHMSPELLLQGTNAKPADVYAFGIFMYELFSGQRPWKGSKPAQIINSVVQNQKRPVFPPTVPRQVVELATRCWAQDPTHRPTFSEVLRDVGDLIKLCQDGVIGGRKPVSRGASGVGGNAQLVSGENSVEMEDSATFGDNTGSGFDIAGLQKGMSLNSQELSQSSRPTVSSSSSPAVKPVLKKADSLSSKRGSISFKDEVEDAAAQAASEFVDDDDDDSDADETEADTVMFMMQSSGLSSINEQNK